MVIANPSTWVLPGLHAVPYGFRGTPDANAALRAYLALPITALLGREDTGTDSLSSEPEAVAQGINRLERGRNTFAKARAAAEAHLPVRLDAFRSDWSGHNSARMFDSAQAAQLCADLGQLMPSACL